MFEQSIEQYMPYPLYCIGVKNNASYGGALVIGEQGSIDVSVAVYDDVVVECSLILCVYKFKGILGCDNMEVGGTIQ